MTNEQLQNSVGSLVRVALGTMSITGDLFWNELHQYFSISVYSKDGFDRDNNAYVSFTANDIANFLDDHADGVLDIRLKRT